MTIFFADRHNCESVVRLSIANREAPRCRSALLSVGRSFSLEGGEPISISIEEALLLTLKLSSSGQCSHDSGNGLLLSKSVAIRLLFGVALLENLYGISSGGPSCRNSRLVPPFQPSASPIVASFMLDAFSLLVLEAAFNRAFSARRAFSCLPDSSSTVVPWVRQGQSGALERCSLLPQL